MKKPNVLILMSDEHRSDVLGYNHNKIIRTPILDKLSKEGCVFENAYTPSPICVPARQCLMSGQLPKTCHCDGSWMDLKPFYDTFAKRLTQHAYTTVCSGKLHHLGMDQMQGWMQRLSPDAMIYPKYFEGLVKEEYDKYSKKAVSEKKSNEAYVKEAGVKFGKYQKYDLDVCEKAKEFVQSYFKESDDSRKPLLLKVSFLQPHYPFFTDKEKFDYYYDKVEVYEDKLCDHPVLSQSQIEKPVNVSSGEIRSATATYYGMVETIDQYYGEILKAIEDEGQNLDDWVIIYLSDHGEMLGEHGIWEKARFYEASVKVPLIIKPPKYNSKGLRINKNVNLCDLYSTLCDLTNIPIPPNLDSRSLVPLMAGSSDWNNESVSQIKRGENYHVMIKIDDLKYQYYGEEIPEVLFDLKNDSAETINVIENPNFKNEVQIFRDRLSALGYGIKSDSKYVNAGYDCGVLVKRINNEMLYPEDSNPWMV